jgi:shikimate kinase
MAKILLVGYMGSGKTTVARLLQKKTGLPFYDLDQLIESQNGLSVAEIFEKRGEIQFRKSEHEILKNTMAKNEDFILSLGGGTPCYANNHLFLNGDGILSFYLKGSVDSLEKRLASNGADRPLLAGKSAAELREFIAKHLFDRSFYYNQATHKIDTDGKTPDAVAGEILTMLA